jgi:hypothetical protein
MWAQSVMRHAPRRLKRVSDNAAFALSGAPKDTTELLAVHVVHAVGTHTSCYRMRRNRYRVLQPTCHAGDEPKYRSFVPLRSVLPRATCIDSETWRRRPAVTSSSRVPSS